MKAKESTSNFRIDVEIEITTIITATTFSAISVTESALVQTNIIAEVPTISPIPALSTVTTVDDVFTDLTVVNILLPTGAGSSIQVCLLSSRRIYKR